MMEEYTSVKQCLDCGSKTVVIDSRVRPHGAIWRKRKCTKCGYSFSTLEIEESMFNDFELLDEIRNLKKQVTELKGKLADIKTILEEET